MILVVDDEPRTRFVIAGMLKRHGYEVAQASDALEALKVISTVQPDVVITDLRMPEIDGADLALQVHANWPGTGVIVMSGYFTGKAQKVISAAWADFIYKPIDKELLLAKIQRLRLYLSALKTQPTPHVS
jgi:c-di-GMP phosphodiesterase